MLHLINKFLIIMPLCVVFLTQCTETGIPEQENNVFSVYNFDTQHGSVTATLEITNAFDTKSKINFACGQDSSSQPSTQNYAIAKVEITNVNKAAAPKVAQDKENTQPVKVKTVEPKKVIKAPKSAQRVPKKSSKKDSKKTKLK